MSTQTNLIKFMYNANLSLMFLYLKQQDISKDYALSLLEYIKKDKDNQEILYNSFIGGLRFISGASFYSDILEKVNTLIDELFENDKKFEKKLEYFNLFKRKEINNDDIKYLVNTFISLEEEKANEYLEKILFIINTIKDKRIKNPLINKLIKYSKNKTDLFKINLNTNLYFLFKEEKYFDEVSIYLNNNDNQIVQKIDLILEIIKNSNDKDYLEKVLNLVTNNIISISDQNHIYILLVNILDVLSIKSFLSNKKEITDKIYIISSTLQNKNYSLKLSVLIIILLINTSNFNQAIILLNRFFSLIYKLDENSLLDIIDHLFVSINKVNFIYRKNFINHITSHIFNFIDRINNKDLVPIILNNFLNILSKLNLLSEMTLIFDKIIEISFKSEKKDKYDLLINNMLNYLHLANNKDAISILNKAIYVSEKSKKDKRLISLLSLAYIKDDLSQEIFYYIRKQLEELIDEEYKSLVIKHFVKILLKMNKVEIFENNIKEILDLKIDNDLIKIDIYLNIAENTIKIQYNNTILLIFNILVDKIYTIKTEFSKFDYILKIFSFISNFSKNKEFEEILYELMGIVNSFENKNLKVNMYKSFMISLLKLGNRYINKLNKEIENDIKSFDYEDYRSEIVSVIGTYYYRTGNFSKANKYFNESLDLLEQINDDNVFFETISNLLIRAISANKSEDFYFIIDKINLLFEILETEEKKFSFFSKIILKIKQLNVINEKYKKEILDIIEKNMDFNNDNLKIFSYNSLIFIFNNINDKENKEIYINKFISFFNKINITAQNIFPLIQIALVLIKGIDKEKSIIIINKIIDNSNLKNYNDAIIFLFKEITFLGSLYAEKDLIEKIINLIKNINLKSLNDRQLYNIAISYMQINQFKEFINTYNNIKDINIKNKIEYEVINLLFIREDNNNLINLISYVLDNSNNLDLLLSYIILLNENKKEIDNIKIF